jgi:uncharacterized protein (DUF1778 family)
MAQQKTSKIALRVEPQLRDRLEAAAELDRRPMTNLNSECVGGLG